MEKRARARGWWGREMSCGRANGQRLRGPASPSLDTRPALGTGTRASARPRARQRCLRQREDRATRLPADGRGPGCGVRVSGILPSQEKGNSGARYNVDDAWKPAQ